LEIVLSNMRLAPNSPAIMALALDPNPEEIGMAFLQYNVSPWG
jgi:hypothetical protein